MSPVARARSFLSTIPGSIAGQRGHDRAMMVARQLIRGYSLSSEELIKLFKEWNAKCVPQWSDSGLKRLLDLAALVGDEPRRRR